MSLAEKIAFAEKHIKAKEGHAWTLKGRLWVRDEFWLAIEGYKLWPPLRAPEDPESIRLETCDDCALLIGTLQEGDAHHDCAHGACHGLTAEPQLVTIANIPRQDGKTFNTAAYALASMFTERNRSIAFVAASEDQAQELYWENYRQPIESNPALAQRVQLQRLNFVVPRTNSLFEATSTSFKSITGRTRTHILVDEARDIEARVVVALVPAILAMGGVECPKGHVQLAGDEAAYAPKLCSACKRPLRKWWPRIVITSSSGVVSEDETGWLPELIDNLQKQPDPNWTVLARSDSRNPRKNPKIKHALQTVLSGVSSMKDYTAMEFSNEWTKKGDRFATELEIKRCVDRTGRYVNSTGTSDPCVAFLDTSLTTDKTSFQILADDRPRSAEPWQHVYQARCDFWLPSDLPGGVIDDAIIRKHLELWVPMFPGLRVLIIDTRGMPWAIRLVKQLRAAALPWAKLVKPWDKRGHESDAGWGMLQGRILNQTITLQDIPAMAVEFRGIKLKRDPTTAVIKVVDTNRNKSHKDITEGLATCCYLVHEQMLRLGSAGMGAIQSAGGAGRSVPRGRAARLSDRVIRPLGGKFGSDRF